MNYDRNSICYIELHYNFNRYNIYNIMVKNYEEFWDWLITDDSDEFVITSSTNRVFKYIRNKISNFYEKQNGIETARSKEITKIKNNKLLYESGIENQLPVKYIENYEADNVYREIEQQIKLEKSYNEKQSSELDVMRKKIAALEKIIAKKTIETEEQRKKRDSAEQELDLLKAQALSYKYEINQYVKTSNDLRQQLVNVQLRAEKAENDLVALITMLSSINDKYYSECNSFVTQFKQIMEKCVQCQPAMGDDSL